ncbi:hypothetical protein cand_021730 [Cryptosporidium andersoni]|uniref:Uncharacterized protein n=1 Tax=Cryptosporidium andersoni TaxID=117008 RepID=A0A1J4MSZ6_9CRYT|nr:hypothetical protein cand_021730 [Cryptosporidium andersoni]
MKQSYHDNNNNICSKYIHSYNEQDRIVHHYHKVTELANIDTIDTVYKSIDDENTPKTPVFNKDKNSLLYNNINSNGSFNSPIVRSSMDLSINSVNRSTAPSSLVSTQLRVRPSSPSEVVITTPKNKKICTGPQIDSFLGSPRDKNRYDNNLANKINGPLILSAVLQVLASIQNTKGTCDGLSENKIDHNIVKDNCKIINNASKILDAKLPGVPPATAALALAYCLSVAATTAQLRKNENLTSDETLLTINNTSNNINTVSSENKPDKNTNKTLNVDQFKLPPMNFSVNPILCNKYDGISNEKTDCLDVNETRYNITEELIERNSDNLILSGKIRDNINIWDDLNFIDLTNKIDFDTPYDRNHAFNRNELLFSHPTEINDIFEAHISLSGKNNQVINKYNVHIQSLCDGFLTDSTGNSFSKSKNISYNKKRNVTVNSMNSLIQIVGSR